MTHSMIDYHVQEFDVAIMGRRRKKSKQDEADTEVAIGKICKDD